jgi:hypothetical protein
MIVILYFLAFIALVAAIAISVSLFKLSGFKKKVVIANMPGYFLGMDNNTQELTYISNTAQISFKPKHIADVRIIEKEVPFGDDSVAYNITVSVILQNHSSRSVDIECAASAQRGSIIYNHGQAHAKAIEKAVTDLAKDI